MGGSTSRSKLLFSLESPECHTVSDTAVGGSTSRFKLLSSLESPECHTGTGSGTAVGGSTSRSKLLSSLESPECHPVNGTAVGGSRVGPLLSAELHYLHHVISASGDIDIT